jgi:hypothetical protein
MECSDTLTIVARSVNIDVKVNHYSAKSIEKFIEYQTCMIRLLSHPIIQYALHYIVVSVKLLILCISV